MHEANPAPLDTGTSTVEPIEDGDEEGVHEAERWDADGYDILDSDDDASFTTEDDCNRDVSFDREDPMTSLLMPESVLTPEDPFFLPEYEFGENPDYWLDAENRQALAQVGQPLTKAQAEQLCNLCNAFLESHRAAGMWIEGPSLIDQLPDLRNLEVEPDTIWRDQLGNYFGQRVEAHRGARRVLIPVQLPSGSWCMVVIDKYRFHTIVLWSCTDTAWERNQSIPNRVLR